MLSGSTNTAIATARKRTSLISTYVPSWSSTRLSLILGVVLGTYPRAASASAVPRKAEPQEDIQQSQAHSSSLDLVLIPPVSSNPFLLPYGRRADTLCNPGASVFPGLPRKVRRTVVVLCRDHSVCINTALIHHCS